VEHFVKKYDSHSAAIAMESPNVLSGISQHDFIVFGYPVYFSNAPKIVQDFIQNNAAHFRAKKIFIIATMGLFSGDGTGCTARLFQKYGAAIIGGLHLKMPDSIGDEKVLKRTAEKNRSLIAEADRKIEAAVQKLKFNNAPREGLGFLYHMAGLFGQRLWFYGKSTSYKKKPDIDTAECIGCGKCVDLCPMKNLSIENGKAVSSNQCTLCYRCFSRCPAKAITILGKKVYEQWEFTDVLK